MNRLEQSGGRKPEAKFQPKAKLKREEETDSGEKKIVKHKLSVLQLAEALGNVSEACRKRGISRTQFYEYKRRFQLYGIEGLKDLSPFLRLILNSPLPEVGMKILDFSRPMVLWRDSTARFWMSF